MYDDFSADYDRFVDWPARLPAELPFIEQQLQAVDASRVLDAACGTGMHAIALAQQGYEVTGTDLSAGMIERARVNADAANVDVRFEAAGFGELARRFAPGSFDALLCLGNSLPHLLTSADLAAALADFAACLRPGGLLLIQNRNFDAVLGQGERWMEPQSRREGGSEWLFLRFYDFEPDGVPSEWPFLRDGTLTFNLATLRREGTGNWSQQITSTQLRPLRQEDLTAALSETAFEDVVCYGDMTGAPFEANRSPNLVVTARP
ncbi:MAG: hypothetical protein DRJ03_26015 [Chloroflexi bacterium]|nr:MAG: hypothetical protein B6I35_15125 [Anaerolineaceae bacterium 4572_32.2]RLC72690.1 MAG: hypothetical protein DRI81_16055 [Chloroflexota bacterium]RLC77942.1 MAG: hypothetical protein DRJ03_26015 [Chloroflexota bacterium]HEY72379.1 class I SAM-dependent methyltransferase [Thermoflexia bacterium]